MAKDSDLEERTPLDDIRGYFEQHLGPCSCSIRWFYDGGDRHVHVVIRRVRLHADQRFAVCFVDRGAAEFPREDPLLNEWWWRCCAKLRDMMTWGEVCPDVGAALQIEVK
jgi:hypothetical protein